MKHLNILSVGSSALVLACLGVTGCSGNDNPGVAGGGGTTSSSTVGGNTAAGGNSSSSSSSSASGGSSSSSTSSASGGSSATSQQGGASSQGGSSSAKGGSSATSTSDTSAKGGSTASGGSSSSAAGGTSAKGGSSSSSNTSAGGNTPVGGSSSSSNTSVGGSTTAGGTSAAGGSSAAAGSSAGGGGSGEVTPTMVSETDYKLDLKTCGVVMDVNPKIGARVSKLQLGGKDIFKPHTATTWIGDDASNNSGSTFWPSPQSGWTPNWPPPAEIDGNAYTPAINGTHLVCTGSASSALGVSVVKDFSADDSTCWISVLYTIKATKSVSAAPWEISRVPRGGIAFFPVGDSTKLAPGPLQAKVTTAGTPTIAWFDDTTKSSTSSDGSKLIADGANGWLAYALGGNLYLKKFADVEPAKFATKEGDIEIYPGTDYLELEVQGAYTSLTANGTLPWTVKWRVVAIPSSVTVAPKSDTLLAFAQEQIAK